MEFNKTEAVKNNIFGSLNLIKIADKYKVLKFVLISSDKAVNPTNIMGATKRASEMLIQVYNEFSATEFVAVRFGNVLSSNRQRVKVTPSSSVPHQSTRARSSPSTTAPAPGGRTWGRVLRTGAGYGGPPAGVRRELASGGGGGGGPFVGGRKRGEGGVGKRGEFGGV